MKSLGIVFPGQGSQFVGMLNDVAQEFSEVRTVFSEASLVLGYDLWSLVLNGPKEDLDKTTHTQPALLAASYAFWQIIMAKQPIYPALLAGHSLGEYTALVCAGSIKFSDAIRLVAARGAYMQEAVPVGQGALAAIVGLDDLAVQEICKLALEDNEVLSPVNFNSPGQVVIGGHTVAVERALIIAKEKGAKLAKLLPVSVPSHCSLMEKAAEKLSILLAQITILPPSIPVVNNVNATLYQDADSIRQGLVHQLYMPVRWVETIRFFENQGIQNIIECGPGKVLSGLNKRITPEIKLINTNDLSNLQALLAAVFEND